MGALIRIITCAWVFGYGAFALGHGALGLIVAGVVALFLNNVWKEQQRQTAMRQHRENVIADEQLRLDVQHRREREGRA